MSKAKQRIASIITTISVTGTLMASFPFTTSAAVVNENNDNKATNVDVSLEDAANYAKNVAIEKNATDYGLCDNVKQGAILHAWCWSFNTIKENLHDIAEAGFTTVQTSPANTCIVGEGGAMELMGNGKWYYHYQPTDWKIGNYQLGSREEFKSMCEEADKYGVKIIVDVIPNHTAADRGAVSQNMINAAGGMDKLYHKNWDIGCTNWTDRNQITNYKYSTDGCPDVCTENPGYQEYYVRYLNDLIECGVDGFRYDTAKHIGLPDDPLDEVTRNNGWTNNFWPVALGEQSVNGVKLEGNTNTLFVYGEVLQDAGSRDADYGRLFNLTASNYGGKLRSAIGSKSFNAGNLNSWDNAAGGDRLVTWVESHDTYCNSHPSAWMSDWDIRMCWAVIAARASGTPLFYSRPDGSNGSTGNYWGKNKIGAKGNDQFKDPEVAAVNKFRNAMVGEGETLRNPNENSKILQIDRGTKGTVIINLGEATSINNETSMANGTYTDQVSGRTFTVSGGNISGQLDAGKIAVIYDAKTTKNPKVSATPGSGSFKGDSVTLTLGLTNATTGTYTTSEGNSGSFKNGDKITVGSSISVGEKVTVTLKANGDDPESTPANETFTYTKKDGSVKKNTVYFTLPSGWSSPTIYAYSGYGTTATKLTGEWPGTAMTSEGDGVYSYTFADSVSSCKVIFASGSNQIPASQQPGFDYVGGKAYEYVSSWVEVPVTTPVEKGTVTVKYVDESGNNLTDPITLTGNVGDSYTTSKKTFSGYTLSSTPTNASGKYTKSGITVTYKYTNDEDPPIEEGKVIVNYVDSDGNKLRSVTLTGNVGDSYTTSEKTFSGYELVSIPSNASGTFKSTTITVTYRYEKIAVADGKVIVKYIDEETQKEIATSTTLTGDVGETYTTSAKQIEGYTLSFVPNNVSGTYKSTTTIVTYEYIKNNEEVKAPVISSFIASKQSPQVSGTQVTLTAKATGTGTLQYKFLIQDASGNWGMLRDYGTSSTYTWTIGAIGTKTLYVDVKDSNGKVTRKSMNYSVIAKAPVISSFTTSKQSPQESGTQVTLTAKATGTGTLQYKFLIQDASGNWGMLRDYGTSSIYTWTTGAIGTKRLYVDVKDSNGKVTRKSMNYSVIAKAPVISSFTTSKQSPQESGTQVTLTAKATGTGTLQYKFLIQDANGNWGMLRDYGTSSTYTWTTKAIGTKTLYVDVKDSNGKVTRKSMSYTVKAVQTAPVVSSFIASKQSPQESGTQVTLTAKATGTGILQYKFLIQDASGNWGMLRDYGTSNTYTWTTKAIGTKKLYVDVKDSNGKVTRKSMSYTVKQSLIEDSNSAITYSGTWKVATSTKYSSGTCKYASSSATATYKFTGTGIKLIATKESNKGIAKVTVDSKVYYVDLYSSSAKNQNIVFLLSGLTSGTHTIKVEWTGLKNDSSTGTTITLDTFDIIK